MSKLYDVVVAGAGPAGLGAAIHAAKAGMSVLVIDPHAGRSIDKACGEGIMPGGVEALERIGVRPAGRPFLGIRYALAKDPTCEAFGNFPIGVGLGVRRTTLSEALFDRAVKSHVRFKEGSIGAFVQGDDTVQLGDDIRAHWLIAADGLRSKVRRALAVELPTKHKPRFGLRRHYATSPWSAHVEVHFAAGAEAYVTPVADDLVGVAILFRDVAAEPAAGAGGRYDSLLERFPELKARLEGKEAASTVRGAGPFEHRVSKRVKGNVLLVGDAAGYLDPLTGEGVALGLATAEAAIECVSVDDPALYERRYQAITRRYFAMTNTLLKVVEHSLLHRPLITLAHAVPSAFTTILGQLSHIDAHASPAHAPLAPEAPVI